VSRFQLSPINQRRVQRFKSNRRGWYSLWIFLILFTLSLGAEFIANDKPLVVRYKDHWYFPIFVTYSEQQFGGEMPTEADYRDPYVINLIKKHGWMLNTPVPFSYNTINYALPCAITTGCS